MRRRRSDLRWGEKKKMKIPTRAIEREYLAYRGEFLTKAENIMRSGQYVYGPETAELESRFRGLTGKLRCIAVNNCTDALFMALRCSGIGSGDEVLVPCNTFVADFLAVKNTGATPVPADIDRFFNIDADRIEAKITPRTKAIIAVHLYGQSADMDAINAVAQKHGLIVIEDCAQAAGALYKGMPVGSAGDIACFSFYTTKNLGAFGDGGMICVDDVSLADKISAFRNYGMAGGRYVSEGINSRMDELQAGLLNVKLAHFDELLSSRLSAAGKYLLGINNPEITLPATAGYSTHTYHQFVVMCGRRDELRKHLAERGIEAQIHYNDPPYLSPVYSPDGARPDLTDFSASVHKKILSLPVYFGLTDEEAEYVVKAVNSFRCGKE